MRVLALFSALLIAGCASAVETAFEEREACRAALAQTAPAQAISNKLWVPASDPPLSYFSNDAYVSDAEKAQIDQVANASLACDQATREAVAEVHPDFGVIYTAFINVKRNLFLALLNGEMSYGEYHSKHSELVALAQEAWSTVAQNVAEQARRAELERQQLALQKRQQRAAEQAAQMEALLSIGDNSSTRRPTTTNCYQSGNRIDCTTWE